MQAVRHAASWATSLSLLIPAPALAQPTDPRGAPTPTATPTGISQPLGESPGEPAATRTPKPPEVPSTPSPAATDVDRLLARADARMAAGDYDGAIEVLAQALDVGADGGTPPRTTARIRLSLVEAHEGMAALGERGHAKLADALRRDLLRDQEALELTAQEVATLEAALADDEEATAAARRGKQQLVEEKVLENEVASDRRMISSGTTMATVGFSFSVAGIVLLIYAAQTEDSLSEFKIPDQESERRKALRDGNAQNGAGVTFLALGGLFLVAGVTVLSIGAGRKRKRLAGKEKRRRERQGRPAVQPTAGAGTIGVRF